MKKPLFLLVDAHALIHRAYHALPPLTVSRTGEPTGAVYGFIRMLIKVLQDFKPTHCAIAFDCPAPTFRHKEFEEYKAHRPETPAELKGQFGRVHQLVDALNLTSFELEGYEADDLLGTLSYRAAEKGIDTIIVTGDTDAFQLISSRVKVLVPQKGFSSNILYDEEEVKRKYGIEPLKMVDLKGLKGDPSDNIPGVTGIGEKTAIKLIQQFGSIEGIYEHINEVAPVKTREMLINQEEKAKLSKRLATIVTDSSIFFELSGCTLEKYNRERLLPLLRELEFPSLLNYLGIKPEKIDGEYNLIDNVDRLGEMTRKLSGSTSLIVHLLARPRKETGTAEIIGIAFTAVPGEAYFVPITGQTELYTSQAMDTVKALLSDSNIKKTVYNGKELIDILTEQGVEINNMDFDSMIAAHLLGEKSLELKYLTMSKLWMEIIPLLELMPKKELIPVDISVAARHGCAEADAIGRLFPILQEDLEETGLYKLFSEVEMPLVPILAGMERNGISLDTNILRSMSHNIGMQLLKLEQEIYDIAGHKFNINSPQQLGKVMFDELGLPGARKTKTGYSTDASVMESLKALHPIIELIMEYRQLTKLKSTYIDALPAIVNPRTGRLHTSFNQAITATGRLSSSDPNLQNIPVRGDLGKQVRKAFIAEPHSLLVGGDYSQIELRILAHFSQDSGLLAAFKHDEDIHNATASEVFGVPLSAVNPEMRRVAKVVNFGIVYGMSEYGLQQATELTREEAAGFIESYFQRFPKVKEYLQSTKLQARENGYVQTILGRRRYIPDINSSNSQVREAAERMAINMPVQGTAADIIKVAMIDVQRGLDGRRLKSKMILQVHDELLLEVPHGELEEVRSLLEESMSGAMELSVPLKVDIKVGANWGEME